MIIVVFGLPGTGKSYFSRHMSEELGAAYLNTDIVRKDLQLEGLYTPQSKRRVYDHLLQRMAEKVREKDHVIVDGTFQRRGARKRIRERSCLLDETVRFIEMRASDRTVARRIKEEREYSEADFKVYMQIKYNFEKMEDPHLILYSDEEPLEKMIEKAKEYIYEKEPDRQTD